LTAAGFGGFCSRENVRRHLQPVAWARKGRIAKKRATVWLPAISVWRFCYGYIAAKAAVSVVEQISLSGII
jgi:hypothetical protein